MRTDFRFLLIAVLAFGLLASLVYPVSPASTAAMPLLSPPVLESLQAGSPHEFKLTPLSGVQLLSPDHRSISDATVAISSSGYAPLVEDSILYGPHITLNGTWDPLDVPGFPTIKIKQTSLEFLYTIEQEHYGTITGPVLGGWNPDHNPREAYDYVYLEKGNNVYVEVEFGTWTAGEGSSLIHGAGDDIDLFVWAPGVEHTYANSLTGKQVPTCCANPEIGAFTAPVTGNYTIGLDYYSGVVPMGWRCYVYRFAIAGGTLFDGRSAVEDTADIGFDGAFDVRLRRITGTSLDLDDSWATRIISNVTFINFFPPSVIVDSPGEAPGRREGPGLVDINWTSSDLNTDETLQSTVEISNDLGRTWKVICYTTHTSTVWDPDSAFYGLPPTPFEADGITRIPNFLVRVNVTDGRFFASDVSDFAWSLDDVVACNCIPIELFIFLGVGVVVVLLIAFDVAVLLYRREYPKKHYGDV